MKKITKQSRYEKKRKDAGWQRLWIPPQYIQKVKKLINDQDKRCQEGAKNHSRDAKEQS